MNPASDERSESAPPIRRGQPARGISPPRRAGRTPARGDQSAAAGVGELRDEVALHWFAEDGFYRFYHQIFKVYGLQSDTTRIVAMLQSLLPERALNEWFAQIIHEGTGKTFAPEHNRHWLAETRPILEAFFHAKTMLDLAVKYGHKLDAAPQMLPSGWAAVLYLFDLR